MRPVEDVEREGRAALREIENGGPDWFRHLPPLEEADHILIARVIQARAYADFSLRTLLDLIEYDAGEAIRPPNRSFRDNEVIPEVRRRMHELRMRPDHERNLGTMLDMIDRFTQIRHQFAHFAVRRHHKNDALVGLSLNRRDANRQAGQQPEHFKALTAYIPLPEVRRNLQALEHNVDVIAMMVAALHGEVGPQQPRGQAFLRAVRLRLGDIIRSLSQRLDQR